MRWEESYFCIQIPRYKGYIRTSPVEGIPVTGYSPTGSGYYQHIPLLPPAYPFPSAPPIPAVPQQRRQIAQWWTQPVFMLGMCNFLTSKWSKSPLRWFACKFELFMTVRRCKLEVQARKVPNWQWQVFESELSLNVSFKTFMFWCQAVCARVSGGSKNGVFPQGFHDHLCRRQQILWSGQEQATSIMRNSVAVLEF